MKIRSVVGTILAVLALGPISALAFVKPVRVVVPQVVSGVHCYGGDVCTDDRARLAEARSLYSAGVSLAAEKVGAFHSRPRVIFCSSAACLRGFGPRNSAAFSVGNLGVVVAPRGWATFYVAHELIHYRQTEEFGWLESRKKPAWLIEGMAYSLSDDPRRPLPEPLEDWRAKFESWNYPPHADFWSAARSVQ